MAEGQGFRGRRVQQLGNAFQQCVPAAFHQPAPRQLPCMVSDARMFAFSRRECGAIAAAWLAALAAARTCRGVRVDDAWPRRPRPAAPSGVQAA